MVAPLAGVVFFGSIFVATATVAFWWIDSGELANAFTYGGRDFTVYPITVYGGWFRALFAYGLGFAFVAYYPALALLGRADPLGLPAWAGWAAPAVALVAAAVAAAGLAHRGPPLPEYGVMSRMTRHRAIASGLRKEFTVTGRRPGRLRREKRMVAAVDGVDLSVERGEMLGYIGPNGAGKSTTLKMLTGVLMPSAGEVRVCGLRAGGRADPAGAAHRRGLRPALPAVVGPAAAGLVRPAAAHLPGAGRPSTPPGCAGCRDLLDLDAFLDTPVRQLSLGQRMRGELTAALLHGPEVLFLDEPTIGLDVVSKQAVRGFLAELGAGRRHHAGAHHPRPGRHRAAVPAAGGDRPRPGGARRHARRAARPVRLAPAGRRRAGRAAAEPPVRLPAGAPLHRVEADGRRLVFGLDVGVGSARWCRLGRRRPRCATSPIVEPDIEDVVGPALPDSRPDPRRPS